VSGGFAFPTGVATHVGCVRKVNEDSVLAMPETGVWAVADGMGGYGGGDVASHAAVASLARLERRDSAADLLSDFERSVVSVNAELRALARTPDTVALGATLVALLIHGAHYACVWCGDSRAYLRRDGMLTQVSRDHSEVQELIDRGVLSEEEALTWPRRNVVTRALGAADKAELDLIDGPLQFGDRFLLCSDGLTGHVTNPELASLLAAGAPQAACDALLRLTLERGAKDNVSIIVVDCAAE
jgi:serine/threonine protein phosphatase PrpC